MAKLNAAIDSKTVESFGSEWRESDQQELSEGERRDLFDKYFGIFPWQELPPEPRGTDVGCGSGRWAMEVAPKVKH